jgi:uncharacterized protein (TIGR02301 family)
MMRPVIVLLAVALAAATPAAAGPPRAPAERQSLVDLAYVLGRSHALRQACAGAADQYWRGRMGGLIAAEAPDPGFERQLREAFNTGYAAARAAFPRCGPRARREAVQAAARGRDLAASLTGTVAEDDPSR